MANSKNSTQVGNQSSNSGAKPANQGASTTPASTLAGTLQFALAGLMRQNLAQLGADEDDFVIRLPKEHWLYVDKRLELK